MNFEVEAINRVQKVKIIGLIRLRTYSHCCCYVRIKAPENTTHLAVWVFVRNLALITYDNTDCLDKNQVRGVIG